MNFTTMSVVVGAVSVFLLSGCGKESSIGSPVGGGVAIGGDKYLPKYVVLKPKAENYITKIESASGKGSSKAAACFDVQVNGNRAANHDAYGGMMMAEGFGDCTCTDSDGLYQCKAEMFLRPRTTNPDGIPREMDGKPVVGIVR